MVWLGWLVAALATAAAVWLEVQRRALLARPDVRPPVDDGDLRSELASALHAAERNRRDLDRLVWVTAVDARSPTVSANDDLKTLRRSRGEHLQAAERQLLDGALAKTDIAVRLLDEVRAWALAEPVLPDPRVVNLREVLDAALVDLDHDGNATLDVEALPEVATDVTVLAPALLAVLDNCLRYRWPGKPVHITITATRTGNLVTMLVRDNGMGLRMEDPDLLFLPFARGDGASAMPGVGLGLALARRAVEALGGMIVFVPNTGPSTGKGATIAITLPAV